mgnify:FL=1
MEEIGNKIDRNILKDYVKTINTTRKNMTKIKDELQEINNKKEVSEEINIINNMSLMIKELLIKSPNKKREILTYVIRQIMQENNGMISTRMIEPLNISRQYLLIMKNNHEIDRIARGIYLDKKCFEDSYFSFQQRYKKVIFSHMNALYFYNMTEEFPYNYTITVPQSYHVNTINKKCNVFYVANNIYEIGLTKVKSPNGNTIYTYDIERCICDIIRSKNRMDPEQVKKTIKQYLKNKDKDLVKLATYAKKMGIETKVMITIDNYQ